MTCAVAGKRTTGSFWKPPVRALLSAGLLWALSGRPLGAAEIDSFTPRGQSLPDVTILLDNTLNERLAEGVARANLLDAANREDGVPDADCNPALLYDEVRRSLYQSFTASWGLKGYALDTQLRDVLEDASARTPLDESIYRDISLLEGPSLRWKGLSDVVRVGEHWIGLDKLGHFFAEGWAYFELTHHEGRTLQEALDWGARQEAGKFGEVTTGVHSYADRVANFQGWRFWNRVLKSADDPLEPWWRRWFSGPLIDCRIQWRASWQARRLVRAWELSDPLELADYVDGLWDEANNCNRYATPEIAEKVRQRIREVSPAGQCPLQPEVCQDGRRRYGDLAPALLHPACLGAGQAG